MKQCPQLEQRYAEVRASMTRRFTPPEVATKSKTRLLLVSNPLPRKPAVIVAIFLLPHTGHLDASILIRLLSQIGRFLFEPDTDNPFLKSLQVLTTPLPLC